MIDYLYLFLTLVAAMQADRIFTSLVVAIQHVRAERRNRPRCEICGADALATRATLSSDGFRSIKLCAEHMHESMMSDREQME